MCAPVESEICLPPRLCASCSRELFVQEIAAAMVMLNGINKNKPNYRNDCDFDKDEKMFFFNLMLTR